MSSYRTPDTVRAPQPLSRVADLNVTPLIDILLVLLIVFMVILPGTQQGLDVDVPAVVQPTRPLVIDTVNVVVEYTADGVLTINSQVVRQADLGQRLAEIYAPRRDRTLYVIGAGTVRYGAIMRIIDAALGAGVERVGIVTEEMRRQGTGEFSTETARSVPGVGAGGRLPKGTPRPRPLAPNELFLWKTPPSP